MRRPDLTLERTRPLAGPVLLGVFLLAAWCTPLLHLATHRSDHTHGPEDAPGHDDDHVHDSDHDYEAAIAAAPAAHHNDTDDDHGHDHDHAEPADLDHHEDDAAPAGPPSPHDHGRASSAHFGLALLEGPPPPFLPPPADTLALPIDVVLCRHHAPAQPHPPVRGPPRLS